MPKNRSTQFKACGAPDHSSCRFTAAANVAAGVTVTPVVDRESSAPAPVPYVQGSNTVVDSATLRTLAEQLRIVSEGLLATQDDMHEAKQEASDARADAATAISQNKALQIQIEQQQQIVFPAYDWRVKGNQHQWEFNFTLIASLTRSLTSITEKSDSCDLDDIAENIKSDISALLYRNKLIKIADSTEDGWLVVKEYVGSEITDNEEDEKHLRRARAAAADKIKKRDDKKPAVRGGRGGYSRGRGNYQHGGYYSGQQVQPQYQYQTHQPYQNLKPVQPNQNFQPVQ